MAALTATVDPDGTKDYLSLQAADTGEQQDLTDGGGDTMTLTNFSTGGTADTTEADIFGWTTGAANFILIEASSSDKAESASYNTSKYRLEVTDPSVASLTIRENYVRVDGLQIRIIYSSDVGQAAITPQAIDVGNELRIGNCRIYSDHTDAGNARGIINDDAEVIAEIYSCIIYNADQSGITMFGATINITNCDNYDCGVIAACPTSEL